MAPPRVAVTGALSYTGRYLTRLLLDEGASVVNLSGRARPIAAHNLPAQDVARVEARPLAFSEPARLERALRGCDVLYCTYWIRFAVGGDTHAAAAERCRTLFEAAAKAGVQKVVFSSHTRAAEDSPFAYIAGKASAVGALRKLSASSGMGYAVVRPCGIFGDTADESVLMNNAAWVLRRVPLFLLAGGGQHRFQPVHVRDMAELMADLGHRSPHTSGEERDACGPDAPTARELFRSIARACGSRALVVPSGLSTGVITALSRPINWATGDVLLDGDDLDLLCSGLTLADEPEDPAIARRRSLLGWLAEVGPSLGAAYVSSMARYYSVSAGGS
ncbi:unnamed protein product [Prorocentrum cordatum]|uniref:NAD-dependent epimerase/dehydratase domain-containing protein n=1 Tax=Prorocentrum cordatum TaxID=2364126 RepID=A0ABN9Y3S4_9DINO|nr:unnamed protein product [Polarella glacialis]